MAEEKQVVSAAAAVRRASPAVTVGLGTSSVVETLTPVQVAEVEKVVETALESLIPALAPVAAPAPAPVAAPAPAPVAAPAPVLSDAAVRLNAALAKANKPLKYRFIKRFTPADVIKFADGSEFTFPLILRNTGGYAPSSEFKTDDEKLANNLRDAAKNPHLGLVEIK